MSAITTIDFNSLTGELMSIFDEGKKTKVQESVGLRLFDVMDTDLRDYKHQLLHGINGMSRVAEGQDFPLVSTSEGDNITYTQNQYAMRMAVTKRNRMFWREENGSVLNQIKKATETVFDQIDQSLADVLAYGYQTSYVDVYGETINNALCPDGDALFSTSHTTKNNKTFSFSNIVTSGGVNNPQLDRQAIIDARILASKFIDSNGVMRNLELNTLIVPPELEDLAEQIIYSTNLPRTTGDTFAANNMNRTRLLGNIKIVTWNRLSNPKHTNGDSSWFLVNDQSLKEACKVLFSQRPRLYAPEEINENKNWEYTLDCFYTIGRGYPAGVYASNGTNV